MKINFNLQFRWKTLFKWILWFFGLMITSYTGIAEIFIGATIGYYVCIWVNRRILSNVIYDKHSKRFYQKIRYREKVKEELVD